MPAPNEPILTVCGKTPPIERAEAIRYLGYGRAQPGEAERALLDAVIDEVAAVGDCRCCWTRGPVDWPSGGEADAVFPKVGPLVLDSPPLVRHLAGCTSAIVFVSTAGRGIDRLLETYKRLSPARALMVQAVGAALVEAWCDALCAQFAADAVGQGLAPRTRFSPGYGQWSLAPAQEAIFSWLEPARRIGVSLTAGGLMVPSKSVSAIVGLAPIFLGAKPSPSSTPQCVDCSLPTCPYRSPDSKECSV